MTHEPMVEACEPSEGVALDPTSAGWDDPVHDELSPGYVVADKYAIKAVLGRGGFAVVYDAEHMALRRPVALKVLHRSQGMPALLLQRFAREVRISALVRHPNVLEVYDAGTLPDGSPFLVMEKIAGLTLYEKLCMEQRLGIDECIELFSQLLTALAALAERGVVHRDIKPENLMLMRVPSGEVRLKLVDFGIALVREERIEPRLTLHGALVGTPHYMAPEQLRCDGVDARVDLYGTAVVMYQALSGKLPFDGETLSALTSSVLYGSAAALTTLRPDCPPRLAAVVERALSREPEQRFASAHEMRDALTECRDQLRTSVASPPPLARRLLLRMSRPRDLGIACALLALAALVPEQIGFASVLRSAFSPRSQPAVQALAPMLVVTPPAALEPAPADSAPVAREVRHTEASTAEAALPAARASARAEPSARSSGALPLRSDARARVEAPAGELDKARSLARRGLSLYLHGELDAAYALYRQATLLAPSEAPAFRGLGLCASRLNRKAEARRAFARYLELASEAADAHLIRARLGALDSER
jgi:serine/threonine protein kinase